MAAILRSHFVTFLKKSFVTLAPGATFLPNWHIAAIAWHLEQVRLGKIKRLIINMPPRSLKSISASVAFPAFCLGLNPARRMICVSYGAELTAKNANDFRALVRHSWYQHAFLMRVSGTKDTENEVVTTARGYRLATSIGGTLTGRGGDIIIIDDPLKALDALSESRRSAVNDWYTNSLVSRLDDKTKGAIVVVMQRVHEDDLTGFLLRTEEPWTVLRLPAIAERDERIRIGDDEYHFRRAGELLHPAREPREVLDRMRRLIGADNFSAQYQQSPLPPEGAMIKRVWILRYREPPPRTAGTQIVQSWDTANKGGAENDWCVCTTWQMQDGRFYLIDVRRERLDYPELKARAIQLARQYSATKVLVEDAGTGTALITELRKAAIATIAVLPDKDKVTRMSVQSAKFEGGLVYLPREAPWLATLEAELFAFPNVKHDDQVDSISQALARGISSFELTEEAIGSGRPFPSHLYRI